MTDARPACIYCGSHDTLDCGEIFDDGTHHIECRACRCAFAWRPLDENYQ